MLHSSCAKMWAAVQLLMMNFNPSSLPFTCNPATPEKHSQLRKFYAPDPSAALLPLKAPGLLSLYSQKHLEAIVIFHRGAATCSHSMGSVPLYSSQISANSTPPTSCTFLLYPYIFQDHSIYLLLEIEK